MLNTNDSSSIIPAMVDGISGSQNSSLSSVALNKIKVEKVRMAPKNASVVSVNSSPNLNYARSLISKELIFDQHIDSRLAYWYKNKKDHSSLIPKIDLRESSARKQEVLREEDTALITSAKQKSKFKKSKSRSLATRGIGGLFRYASLAAVSFAFFYVIFNYPVVKVQSKYFYNQLIEAKNKDSNNTALVRTTKASQDNSISIATNTNNSINNSFNVAQNAPVGNRIIIPNISVEAPIVLEPSREEEAYQKALAFGVVHYGGTSLPGEVGNMVIGGHSSSDWWKPGDYKFIFVNLDKLKVGDRIEVQYEQKKYIYQVEGSKIVEPTDLSVIAPTNYPSLTLFTCTPPGTNWKRLIISARLIEPMPTTTANNTANDTSSGSSTAKNNSLPGSSTQTNFVAKSIGNIIDLVTKPLNSNSGQVQRFSLPTTMDV